MSLLSRVPFRLTRALLLPGLGLANLTLSAAQALAGTHEHVLRIDPGAANRDLTLDTAEQNKGRWYIVRHVGAANSVVVKDGATVLACGQYAAEADLVGLYDVFTAPAARGHGLARQLCSWLLARAAEQGARHAYLQVEGDNAAARAVYHRLGFADAYACHYRTPETGEV